MGNAATTQSQSRKDYHQQGSAGIATVYSNGRAAAAASERSLEFIIKLIELFEFYSVLGIIGNKPSLVLFPNLGWRTEQCGCLWYFFQKMRFYRDL
ncbi:hypothetical protein Y032_0001g325 [Ancylostoma ceylanicum]|uniref:Uncharacterized protein n=1 Tax=Ancylostoma ceylanicum TaxID=53326 RepID=A0A016W319_9BILA|nr:hypothetical protein Y032_0001g325 [Ancylostoma ceylanicum]